LVSQVFFTVEGTGGEKPCNRAERHESKGERFAETGKKMKRGTLIGLVRRDAGHGPERCNAEVPQRTGRVANPQDREEEAENTTTEEEERNKGQQSQEPASTAKCGQARA